MKEPRRGGRRIHLLGGRRGSAVALVSVPERVEHVGGHRLEGALGRLVESTRLQGDRAIEDLMFALYCAAQRHLAPNLRFPEVQRVHLHVRGVRGRQREMGTRHLDVLHEESADGVVRVA